MAPSVRVRLGKKAKEGPCAVCPHAILKGVVHAAVLRAFGLSQKGVPKWRGEHVHLACLPAFLIADYTRYVDRQKKPRGRQAGSSPFKLEPEQLAERKHLIRTRARLLRLVLATSDKDRIARLKERVVKVQS
ncbi:MAG: hypothetical protein GTO63_35240, partial [Anaerolineae bacterium]|nr:hypothetical protein [Anaerolineae bacterium]NIN96478.1 hypothetical protein [Anaerolineae bacterium]NIQ79506.1 hypothetical protein [Anaerolineae bacterium]